MSDDPEFLSNTCQNEFRRLIVNFLFSIRLTNDMDVKKLIFPGACFFCLTKTNNAWCNDCEQDFMLNIARCPVCARKNTVNEICGTCLKQKPSFVRTKVLFNYQYPANHLIKAFKFNKRPELARCFANRFTKNILGRYTPPEILLPVPLHRKRQQERGYNQSLEFAKHIGKQLTIEVNTSLCKRIKNTDPQSTLPMKIRRKNVKGAFSLDKKEPLPKHIAIIDDVITTGSTVNELASLLERAGCKRIEIWAIART